MAVDDLLRRIGLGDRELAQAIGSSQPTMWRLRNGRLKRPGRHLPALRELVDGGLNGDEVDELMSRLRPLARRSQEVRDLLCILVELIHIE